MMILKNGFKFLLLDLSLIVLCGFCHHVVTAFSSNIPKKIRLHIQSNGCRTPDFPPHFCHTPPITDGNNFQSSSSETSAKDQNNFYLVGARTVASTALASTILFSCGVGLAPLSVNALSSDYYASETVQRVIRDLKENSGNVEAIVHVYEDIAAIITEGKGVGGEINYQGIQLERGFVSDEDTTIYNPGLTLLTESEKAKIVEAVVESRKTGITSNQWNVDTQAGYDFVRERLDPLHMYELNGYLRFVPFYVAILYAGVTAIQQFARDLFAPAYIIAALSFFLPAFVLVAIGPQ